MIKELIKVTPDKEKAKSILKMVDTSIDLIKAINLNRFPSNVTKEYYDVIRELISIILLIDGYKTRGEGAHKALIEYLDKNYRQFSEYEISIIEDLRITRNRIAYDGFFVTAEYVLQIKNDVEQIIAKLKALVQKKLY